MHEDRSSSRNTTNNNNISNLTSSQVKDKNRVKYVLIPLKKSASDKTKETRPKTNAIVKPRKFLFTPECRPGTPNPRLGRPPRPENLRPARPRPTPNASDSQVHTAQSQKLEIQLQSVDPFSPNDSDFEEEMKIVKEVMPVSRRQTSVLKLHQTHFQLPRIVPSSRPASRMASNNSIRTTTSIQNISSCSCTGGWGDDKKDEKFHKNYPLGKTSKESITNQFQNMNSRYIRDLEWTICNAVNIYIFRNGEEGASPVLINISPAWKQNMKTVMQLIENRIRFPGDYAKNLYKMDGTRVRHPTELEMYANYVVAPSNDRHFKCAAYGLRKSKLLDLNKESKHVRVLRLANEGFDDCHLRKRACGDERQQFCFPDIAEKEFPDQMGPSPSTKGKRKPGYSEPFARRKGQRKGRDYGVNMFHIPENHRDSNELLTKSRYGPYGFPLNKDGLKPLEKTMSKSKLNTFVKKEYLKMEEDRGEKKVILDQESQEEEEDVSPLKTSIDMTEEDFEPDETKDEKFNSNILYERPLLTRLKNLYDSKLFSDVTFLVGNEKKEMNAHRLILTASSPIFAQMHYGSHMWNNCQQNIKVPDCNPKAFEIILRAMYTNDVPVNLGFDLSLEVFDLARKYHATFIVGEITRHLLNSVTISNVFDALRLGSTRMELTALVPVCLKLISRETEELLDHHLGTMDATTLRRVLERDYLSLDEVTIFKYLVRWATTHCRLQDMKVTGKNKRSLMESLLRFIRFPTMPLKKFQDTVVPARILDQKEVAAITSHINDPTSKVPLPMHWSKEVRFCTFKSDPDTRDDSSGNQTPTRPPSPPAEPLTKVKESLKKVRKKVRRARSARRPVEKI